MKYLFLIIILLAIPFTLAQDIVTSKYSYSEKETFQAEIFSEDIRVQDISVLNFLNFRANIGINLVQISNNHYFVHFDIPDVQPGNYSLKVKDSREQFKIIPKKDKIISISPSFIKATPIENPLVKVIVSNQGVNEEIIEIKSSKTDATPSVNSLIIPGKSTKSFYITLKKSSKNYLASLSLADYKIPIWFVVDQETKPFFEEPIKDLPELVEGLEFYTQSKTKLNSITKEIEKTTPIVDSIYFKNILNETINNLKITLTGNIKDIVSLEFEGLSNLVPNEEKKLGITVNEDRFLLEDFYSGELSISSDKHTFKLPINFIVVEEAEEPEFLEEPPQPIEEEEPEPEVIKEEPPTPKGKYIYLLVLILVLVVIAYFSIKKPKAKKQSFREFVKKIKH